MAKALFIAEKPSVAREFARALHEPMENNDGFLESERAVVTWCVGHLVTMSYPEAYPNTTISPTRLICARKRII